MNYRVSIVGDIYILQLVSQKFDRIIVAEFKNEMNKVIDAGCTKIVVDISEVDYVDSSALGAIVNYSQKLDGKGQIILAGTKEPVMQLLKLTRLNKLFRFCTSTDIAIENLNSDN